VKRVHVLSAAALGVAVYLLASPAPAQTVPPGGVIIQGLARTSDLMTQGRLDLYVCEGPGCSDSHDCSYTRPCRNPSAACARIPPGVNHEVNIWVDGGTYGAGLCNIVGKTFGGTDFTTKGLVHFRGQWLSASLDGGTSSGTATSVTVGSGSAWAVINDTGQSWVPSAMTDGGYWVQITGGSGSDGGWMLPVIGNTATSLSVPGQFYTAPATGSAYQIVEPGAKITGRLPVSATSPGIGPATISAGVSRIADIIAFNNYAPGDVYGSPPTPAPIIVQGFWFVGDGGTASNATVLADSTPISLEENRWTDFGSGHRVYAPLSHGGHLGIRRSHIDTSGRVATYTETGVQIDKLAFEQNDVQGASGVFSLDLLREFQSRNNFVRGPKSGSGTTYLRTSTCTTCSIAGDRFAPGSSGSTQTLLVEMNRGNIFAAGNGLAGNVTIDGVTAPNVGGVLGWIATSGNVVVQIDHGAGFAIGYGASTISILDGMRAITAGTDAKVYWKHGVTSWTMLGTEITNSIQLTGGTIGGKLSDLEASSNGLFADGHGAVIGWGDGADITPGGSANAVMGHHFGPIRADYIRSESPLTLFSVYPAAAITATTAYGGHRLTVHAFTMTHLSGYVSSAAGGVGSVIFRVSDGTNNCDVTLSCASDLAATGPIIKAASGTCAFAASAALSFSTTTAGCTPNPTILNLDVVGKSQ
jgi:hypothetical protein